MAAKNDRDLFDRLRSAGLRKQVARHLSGIGEDAGRKAIGAARAAISELRTVADEIERRLPVERATRSARAHAETAERPARRARTRATADTGGSRASSARAPAPAARGRSAPASGAKRAQASGARGRTPAPRGHNKALILQALADGPKTASEVARQTGIATGTTSTTLNKLARSGEVVKATRGYALPSSPGAADRGSSSPRAAAGGSSPQRAGSGDPSTEGEGSPVSGPSTGG